MSDERYLQIQRVFVAVRESPPAERDGVLDRECADDSELRREVESLLAHDEETGTFLAAPAMGDDFRMSQAAGLESGAGPATEFALPERIDNYRIHSLLGEGGFGLVYRAREEGAVRRDVALKVIKPGMDSKAVIARFEAERQALAMMEHPNVAKVFGGGTTEESRPYFVMEYVPGLPFTAHCDKHQLTIRDRLRLFAEVCEAVQHAHQKGVIHRDLKPSNILVRYADGKATPKVIDFGVAKALGAQLSEETIFTQRGELVGTPAYMSPEQADYAEQDIDTRSDIYSLGVVLYELLTGLPPFTDKTLRGVGLAEIQRVIREETPPKPSTRLATIEEGATAAITKSRRATVHVLNKTVRGDLDWVVMKCLEKDRERRYESASELAADIGRYLNTEPVMAGPPSVGYKVSKFVQKHRVGVGAAAVVAVVVFGLLVGLAALSYELSRSLDAETVAVNAEREQREAAVRANEEAVDAREEAEAALVEAERRQRQAEMGLGFIENLFQAADPQNLQDAELSARDLAKELARIANEAPPEDAYAEFRVRRASSFLQQSLGEYADAIEQSQMALDAMGRTQDEDIDALTRLTADFKYAILLRMGDPDTEKRGNAQQRCFELVEEITTLADIDDPRAWNALNECATLAVGTGDADAALDYVRRALARQEQAGYTGVELGYTYFNLMFLTAGFESIGHGERAVDLLERELGDDHPHVLILKRDLGTRLIEQSGTLEPAEAAVSRGRGLGLMRDSLRLARQVYGPTHVTTGDFAWLLFNQLPIDSDEAEALGREFVAAYHANPDVHCEKHRALSAYEKLSLSLRARGKWEDDLNNWLQGLAQVETCINGEDYLGELEKFHREVARTAYTLAIADPMWRDRAVEHIEACAQVQLQYLMSSNAQHKGYRDKVLGWLTDVLDESGRHDEADAWRARYAE